MFDELNVRLELMTLVLLYLLLLLLPLPLLIFAVGQILLLYLVNLIIFIHF